MPPDITILTYRDGAIGRKDQKRPETEAGGSRRRLTGGRNGLSRPRIGLFLPEIWHMPRWLSGKLISQIRRFALFKDLRE